MANPLINSGATHGRPQPVAPQNPLQYMTQFMQNPLGALRASGYSIPDGINDPRQIANHLISSGQLGRGKLEGLEAANVANHKALETGLITLDEFQAAAKILVAYFLK